MKKTIILLLIALALIMSIAVACDEIEPTQGTGGPPVESEYEAVVSEEPEPEMRLNYDLLSDLGLTFEEIRERRGEVVGAGNAGGGMWYKFENGYGLYIWPLDYVDWDGEPIPMDENDNFIIETAPLPRENVRPADIRHIHIYEVFLGINFPITVASIANLFQIMHRESSVNRHDTGFVAAFLYENIEIRIFTFNTTEEVDIYSDGAMGCICRLDEPWILDNCVCARKEFSNSLTPLLIFDENSTVSIRLNFNIR